MVNLFTETYCLVISSSNLAINLIVLNGRKYLPANPSGSYPN
jgi:hypothetical protein